MKIITLIAALFLAPVPTHVKGPVPSIVSREKVQLDECDDPIGCNAEKLVVYNPRKEPVLVMISCGSDFDETQLPVYPHTKQTVTIEMNIPGATCLIHSWLPLTEKK